MVIIQFIQTMSFPLQSINLNALLHSLNKITYIQKTNMLIIWFIQKMSFPLNKFIQRIQEELILQVALFEKRME